MADLYHAPVLLGETIRFMEHCHEVLDCTLGGGGHARALLEMGAQVTALDQDPDAIAQASRDLAAYAQTGKITFHLANFAAVEEIPALLGHTFDGVLLDLGVSSRQFDAVERGFTFRPGAPLDMRMSPNDRNSAADLLNTLPVRDLELMFREYADEPRARRLAAEILKRRASRPYETSDDLVNSIRAVLGPRSGAPDFARVFQALRIAVNDEIKNLSSALPMLRNRLKPYGVMVVISYHSGEDRIVKNEFRNWTKGCVCPPRQPVCTCGLTPMGETLTKKAITASDAEVSANPRARSARLRAWRKNR